MSGYFYLCVMSLHGIDSILADAGLKNTSTRRSVLEVFQKNSYALNYNEIQENLGVQLDKVTIYRNLKTFEEVGIIHQVPDMGGSIRYALCSHQCSENHHHDSHVHFNCHKCEKTYCLENTQIPHLTLPKGYLVEDMTVLVKGICEACHKKMAS